MTKKVRFKVYNIENRMAEMREAGTTSNFEGSMYHKVIVFACKTKNEQERLLQETDFCLVGNKLVQRHKREKKLWITELDTDELYQIHETPVNSQMTTLRMKAIDLDDIMRKRDANHVIFGPVPKSSHLYIKSNVPNKEGKLEYYS